MSLSATAFVPPALAELAFVPARLPGPGPLLAIACLGVLCSAVAYLWWNQAIRVLGVTATSSLVYGIPLVGVAVGVLLPGEPRTSMAAGMWSARRHRRGCGEHGPVRPTMMVDMGGVNLHRWDCLKPGQFL